VRSASRKTARSFDARLSAFRVDASTVTPSSEGGQQTTRSASTVRTRVHTTRAPWRAFLHGLVLQASPARSGARKAALPLWHCPRRRIGGRGASRRPPSRLSRPAQRPVGAGPHGHQKPGTPYGLDSQRAALSARWSRLVRARKGRAPVADQPPRKTSPLLEAHADEKAPDLTTASSTLRLALCVQGRNPPAWRRLCPPLSRVGAGRGGGAGAPAPAASLFAARIAKVPPWGPQWGAALGEHQAAALDPGRACT